MNEKQVMLKAYRKEVEILTLEMDVPYYEDLEKRMMCGTYEDTFLKVHNNMREDDTILEVNNYYGSNVIELKINFTKYMEESVSSTTTKEEAVEHLKNWFAGNHDIKNEDIKARFNKGYIYEVDEWENGFESFDKEKDEPINNFVKKVYY